jgi:hypothetical protein
VKRGDLVLLLNTQFEPGESHFAIFWEDNIDFVEWGYLPEVNCTIYWMDQFIPFIKEDLEVVNEMW